MVEIRKYTAQGNPFAEITITISDKVISYNSRTNYAKYELDEGDSKETIVRKLCLEQGTPLSRLKLEQTTRLFDYPIGNKEVHISITTKKFIKYTKNVRVQIMSDKGLEPIFEYEQVSWKPVGKFIKERLAALVDIDIDDVEEWNK